MADRPTPLDERPVLAGLLALVGVGLVVGLLAGLMVLMGTKVLGIGGGDGSDAADSQATSDESLYLPEPSETVRPSGPLITLDPTGPTPTGDVALPTESPSSTPTPEVQINLTIGQSAVPPMGQIDLAGSYPQGEGAILQVQRFANGAWSDFPVLVSVNAGTFSTFVRSGQLGETKFRVVDTDSGLTSNEVAVTVG